MMVWWFFILGCGAVGFTVKILLDHIKDADQINDQIFSTRNEITVFEEKLGTEELETNELKQELEQIQIDLNTKKSTVETLQKQISKRKSVLAMQGKFKLDT